MIVHSEQTTKKEPFDGCTIQEYPFKSDVLNIAIATITKRYPKKGMALNTECEEVYYVLDGTGTIHIKTEAAKINRGDVCIIPKKNEYFVEGNITLLISTSPPWTPEQHRNV